MTDSGSRGNDRVTRALEVVVFAPLGIGLYLKDMAPSFMKMFVARGRAEVDRRQEQVDQRVRHAKGMGEVAVAFGVPMLRKRADEKLASVRDRAETALRGTVKQGEGPEEPRRVHVETEPQVTAEAGPTRAAPRSGPAEPSLAIPGYDALSASQVVEHLAGLGGDELDAVRAYESSHRNRRTILGKIDQLTH